MKQFAAMAFAAFVGVLAALLLYYVFVTRPGIQTELARVDRARADAKQVGVELEKAADASVAHVRAGLDSQARDMRRRALFGTALAAGQGAKLAVTESYMSMGRWPGSAAEVGWGDPAAYANDGARGVSIEPGGVVRIDLTDELAHGAAIRLIPSTIADYGTVKWRCELAGDASLASLSPDCKLAGTGAAAAQIGDAETPESVR